MGGYVAHKLREVRTLVGMSRPKLSELSGVALATIVSIEDESSSRGKIHISTAALLEEALNMERKIFHPSELTNVGRPAATGIPIEKQQDICHREVKCPSCYLLVPRMSWCGWCGGALDEQHAFGGIVGSLAM